MTPQGFYEDVERGEWRPVTNEAPIWFISKIPEAAFAKSAGGAIVGALSDAADGNEPVTLYVYMAVEEPDVDLSGYLSNWIDFHAIKEVRYRRPIGIQFIGKITLGPEDIKRIMWAYESGESEFGYEYPPASSRIRRVAAELDRRFWAANR
jgi:hypothetical protein